MHAIRPVLFLAALLLAALCLAPAPASAAAPAVPQAGKPVQDAPQAGADRTTAENLAIQKYSISLSRI